MNQVHISTIKSGDTIIHNGKIVTVTNKDIKSNSFIGITIFGDSYKLGYKSSINNKLTALTGTNPIL